MQRLRLAHAALAAVLLAPLARADEPAWLVPGGDAERGPALIRAYGCAACHAVPGVEGADGNVGPPLTRFGDRHCKPCTEGRTRSRATWWSMLI